MWFLTTGNNKQQRRNKTHLLLARSPVFLVVVAICQFCILVCAAGAEDTLVPVFVGLGLAQLVYSSNKVAVLRSSDPDLRIVQD